MIMKNNVRSANVVDAYVGSRLRHRREELSLSQDKLASEMDVSFQQLQKYERGINRLSASRLFELANLLNIEVSYFFDGINNITTSITDTDYTVNEVAGLLVNKFALDFLALFSKASKKKQKVIMDLIQVICEE